MEGKHDPRPTQLGGGAKSAEFDSSRRDDSKRDDSRVGFDGAVDGFDDALGEYVSGRLPIPDHPDESIPVFHQILDPVRFFLGFAPGSTSHQVLTNDLSRFTLPRSLPRILSVRSPEDEDNPTGAYVITRHAYSDGAFVIFRDLLEAGYQFTILDFLDFAVATVQALAFLHEHEVVQGQWNARSLVAIPLESQSTLLHGPKRHRFEILNTGVCFAESETIPDQYLQAGYFPPESYVTSSGLPDYGAIDRQGDVFCFCAFLKDMLHRACSTEDLATQAARISEAFQREANRRGLRASPEQLRQKEQEILDHLHTIKVKTEDFIQAGLEDREHRATAAELLDLIMGLHTRASKYGEELPEKGYDSASPFGEALLHYTAFTVTAQPERICRYEDNTVTLEGSSLPRDVVRITLSDRGDGVHLHSATSARIEFRVSRGFPAGKHRLSINNRRTNVALEVFNPRWGALEPDRTPIPWEGFGDIEFVVRGDELPGTVPYSLKSIDEEGSRDGPNVAAVEATSLEATDEGTTLRLAFDPEIAPGPYELLANDLPTGLRLEIDERLPDPTLLAHDTAVYTVKNHRAWTLRIPGRDLHPDMKLDLGEDAPRDFKHLVENDQELLLVLPVRYPPGTYPLRLNNRVTDVSIVVSEPAWRDLTPASLKFRRSAPQPATVEVTGGALPEPRVGEDGYNLRRGRKPLAAAGLGVIKEESASVGTADCHRLEVYERLPRGQFQLYYGDLDTGMKLRVRRQFAAPTWATIILLTLVTLGALGLSVANHFEPRIDHYEPAQVFLYGQPSIILQGKNLNAVELIRSDGTSSRHSLEPVDGAEDRYRLLATGLEEDAYEIVPSGLFSKGVVAGTLVTVQPRFQVTPERIHRNLAHDVRIESTNGFPVASLAQLELSQGDAPSARTIELSEDGLCYFAPDLFGPHQEGPHRLVLRGAHPSETMPLNEPLEVVGPRVSAIEPQVVTLDERGEIAIKVVGQDLLPNHEVRLTGADSSQSTQTLSLQDHEYRGTTGPGTFALELVRGNEALPLDVTLEVLPLPMIAQVEPAKLDPGVESQLTFRGLNLRGLPGVTLRSVADPSQSVRLDVLTHRIQEGPGDQELFLADAVSLPSGAYQVEPASSLLTIEVFQDCVQVAESFRDGRVDVQALVACLENERPSLELVLASADLLFDLGHFAEARALYSRTSAKSLRASFRDLFLAVFLFDESPWVISMGEYEPSDEPYAQAIIAMDHGSSPAEPFNPSGPLSWELEFLRGTRASSPEIAVASYELSMETKQQAAGASEVRPFSPTAPRLARAYLDLAVKRIKGLRGGEAVRLLRERVLASDFESLLAENDRARAHFWLGHLELWLEGNRDSAAQRLEQGSAFGAGTAASWCRYYLASLPGGNTGEPDPKLSGDPWVKSFLPVHRFHREITSDPNYNLLTERYDFDVYITENDRNRSVEFQKRLRALEKVPRVSDPLAHYALLHSLRSAQSVAWPLQPGGTKAEDHRRQLLSLPVVDDAQPLRDFYLLEGQLFPLGGPQLAVLTPAERNQYAQQIQELQTPGFPARFKARLNALQNKLAFDPPVNRSQEQ